ncbi:hypothetical protein ACLOJK_020285 [Asimina triloba]
MLRSTPAVAPRSFAKVTPHSTPTTAPLSFAKVAPRSAPAAAPQPSTKDAPCLTPVIVPWPVAKAKVLAHRCDCPPLKVASHEPKRVVVCQLSKVELKVGWRYPPKRHTTYPRSIHNLGLNFINKNCFVPFTKLTCFQKKELDQTRDLNKLALTALKSSPTLSLQWPNSKRESKRRRKTLMTSVKMTEANPTFSILDTPRQIITCSIVVAMPSPLIFCSLSRPLEPQSLYTYSFTVASYMVTGDKQETSSPKSQRIPELKDEPWRIKLVIDSIEATKGATSHPSEECFILLRSL